MAALHVQRMWKEEITCKWNKSVCFYFCHSVWATICPACHDGHTWKMRKTMRENVCFTYMNTSFLCVCVSAMTQKLQRVFDLICTSHTVTEWDFCLWARCRWRGKDKKGNKKERAVQKKKTKAKEWKKDSYWMGDKEWHPDRMLHLSDSSHKFFPVISQETRSR